MMTLMNKDKVLYFLPESWYEVNTRKYLKLTNTLKLYTNEDGSINLEEDVLVPILVEILSGFPKDELYDLPFDTVLKIKSKLMFLAQQYEPSNKQVSKIEIPKYYIKQKNFDKLSFGDFVDIMHIKNISEDNLIKVMASYVDVYEKPSYKKFKFTAKKLKYTIEQKEEILHNMPCTYMQDLHFFFINSSRKQLKTLVRSLEVMALKQNMSNILQATGHIIFGLWMLVVRTLRNWNRSSTSHIETY